MAARRAKAKEEAPPPPPEPVPEPEPEKSEEPAPTPEPVQADAKSSIDKDGKVTEKIIERIIICPGMQGPGCGGGMGMMGPPGGYNPMMFQGQQPSGPCPTPPGPPSPCPCYMNKKKNKKKKKMLTCDDLCKHPFCIVQRARARELAMPRPPPPPPPPVVVCQRPVLCCCPKCHPPPESDSEEEEEEDPQKNDTETFMTFMNLVFAAANVINERPEVIQ